MNTKKLWISVGVVVIAIVIVFLVVTNMQGASTAASTEATPETTTTSTPTPDQNAATTTAADTSETSKYKDGTYAATGTYQSPGGPDQVQLSLTIKNDIVVAMTCTPIAGDPTSTKYQNEFASGIQALVVGQNIDSLNVTKVSGSSLTGIGFNDALSQIKTQAQA